LATLADVIHLAIEDGLVACRYSYRAPGQESKLAGAVAGFEACRRMLEFCGNLGQLLPQFQGLIRDAAAERAALTGGDPGKYWEARCKEAEIEWVANVLSAVLQNMGLPTVVPPTARGYAKAAEIVGVKE